MYTQHIQIDLHRNGYLAVHLKTTHLHSNIISEKANGCGKTTTLNANEVK